MTLTIAICAPARPIRHEVAERVTALAAAHHRGIVLDFHPQCFAEDGHFAGDDAMRLAALLDCANDSGSDAVWFARGGYGSNRIARDAVKGMGRTAKRKRFLGYSDCGYVLAELYRHRVGHPAHGPMAIDGEAAVLRALDWFSGCESGLEPSIDARPTVAFNLTTLAMAMAAGQAPDLAGHVVMVEEVHEYLYAVDRLFYALVPHLRHVAGLRLGRVSDVPVNEVEFGLSAEEIARHWCAHAGIAYLGRADIGHDADNRIVPFGLAGAAHRP